MMLTTLGIVIGTAAVIAVVLHVQGVHQVTATNEVQNLAGYNEIVSASGFRQGGTGEAHKMVMTYEDGEAIMPPASVTVATGSVASR